LKGPDTGDEVVAGRRGEVRSWCGVAPTGGRR
jgi:hypothetical protein